MEEKIKMKLMLHPVVISLACAAHCDYNKANTEVNMGPGEPNLQARQYYMVYSDQKLQPEIRASPKFNTKLKYWYRLK